MQIEIGGWRAAQLNKLDVRGCAVTLNRICYWGCLPILAGILTLASPAAAPEDSPSLHLGGYIFMEPIGTRRVLVAIASQPRGVIEHIFLYTAAKDFTASQNYRGAGRIQITPRVRNVEGTLDYQRGKELEIILTGTGGNTFQFTESFSPSAPTADRATVRFNDTVGLNHYVASPPLKWSELEEVHAITDCDDAPKVCIEVGGQNLPFAE